LSGAIPLFSRGFLAQNDSKSLIFTLKTGVFRGFLFTVWATGRSLIVLDKTFNFNGIDVSLRAKCAQKSGDERGRGWVFAWRRLAWRRVGIESLCGGGWNSSANAVAVGVGDCVGEGKANSGAAGWVRGLNRGI
jgi:hypothetical protein